MLFTRVADDAHATGQLEREEIARDRASALEPTPAPPAPEAEPVTLQPIVVPGADDAELSRQLQSEVGTLADLEVGIRELEKSAALLLPTSAKDARTRKLRTEIAALDASLAEAWRVARRATSDLASRKGAKAKAPPPPPDTTRVSRTESSH